ncbi:hypothetical protein BGZ76_008814 [Entomortierella beljakovae]|nr:hypothetical protein BGZ76_008814 [Entomortierella beljakovae]
MRFSVIALVATVAAVANAQSDLYPFAADGPCVTKCLLDVGVSMFPAFTDDPASPNFMESLSYAHSKGQPKYTAYMTKTGPCIGACPASEQEFYLKNYPAKQAWYDAKLNGGTTTAGPTGTATTSFSHPVPTGSDPSPTSGAGSLVASSLVGALTLISAAALF